MIQKTRKAQLLAFMAVLVVGWVQAQTEPAFDLVISDGHIMDGTGSPWYSGDLGIRAGKIAAIGNLSQAARKRTIDAGGKVVAPGFIDMLGQSEMTILVDPRLPSKIFQGITSEITGEGNSIAPLNDAIIQSDRKSYEYYNITPDWRTFRQYFARLEKQGIGINLGSYVGATQVRRMVLGDEDRQPTPEQLEQMKTLVREAMKDGAVGVSTSLEYAPAPYAKTAELIALAAEAGKFGGIYATHMRNESDPVLEAIDEALRIGREGHIPVEIWHIKVAGKSNWGRMPEVVAKINAARAAGVDVSADTYAYTAWYNDFSAFIPPWAHDGGDPEARERLKDPATRARIRKDMLTPSPGLGQRVAGDSRAGSHHDRSGAESRTAFHAGQAPLRSRQAVEQRSHRRAVRLSHSGSEHGCGRVWHVAAGRDPRIATALGFDLTTIPRERLPRGFWATHTLIPAHTERSREFSVSMFAKTRL